MSYFYEILNVLEAMMAAYGLIDKNVIEENIELNKEFQKEDGEWILELADMLERRWDEKVSQQKSVMLNSEISKSRGRTACRAGIKC